MGSIQGFKRSISQFILEPMDVTVIIQTPDLQMRKTKKVVNDRIKLGIKVTLETVLAVRNRAPEIGAG